MRLSYFNQKEDYKLILHNNTPTAQDYKYVGGSSSYGDFGTMLRKIFELRTEARFEWDHWGTLRGQRVHGVRLPRGAGALGISHRRCPMSIWISSPGITVWWKSTSIRTRSCASPSKPMVSPSAIPSNPRETILDYDYTDLSGHMFLLPLKGQVFMTAADIVTRNDESFHNYRKYSADSAISFDDDGHPARYARIRRPRKQSIAPSRPIENHNRPN